jgi:hypothetical protein
MAGILKMLDGPVDIYVTDFESCRRTSDSGLRETPGKDSRVKNESCSHYCPKKVRAVRYKCLILRK